MVVKDDYGPWTASTLRSSSEILLPADEAEVARPDVTRSASAVQPALAMNQRGFRDKAFAAIVFFNETFIGKEKKRSPKGSVSFEVF